MHRIARPSDLEEALGDISSFIRGLSKPDKIYLTKKIAAQLKRTRTEYTHLLHEDHPLVVRINYLKMRYAELGEMYQALTGMKYNPVNHRTAKDKEALK